MKILGYSWAGVPTKHFEKTMHFLEQVLGLPLVRREEEQDFGMFRLPSDELFEVFGPKSVEHSFMTMPVMAFDVENIHEARAELESQGVEFVTKVETSPSGENAWTYFVGPDGFLYEIWQRGKKTDTT